MAVRVRQLFAVGTHIDPSGTRVINQVGDTYDVTDAYLNQDFVRPGGPTTIDELVQSYVDAGLVEIIG
jgi:hypothetical protein